MSQLWRLATAWYATRLEAEARRPRPDEALAIFASIGLAGRFWDPTTDRF